MENFEQQHREGSRLTVLYIIALSAVAILSIVGQVLVQRSLHDRETDSRLVNIAGRQRMLSQKLAKAALAIAASGDDAARSLRAEELTEVVNLWRQSHEALLRGDKELGEPPSADVLELFAEIEIPYSKMLRAADELLHSVATPSADGDTADVSGQVREILDHEAKFLAGMDRIVFLYDREAQQRVTRLRRLELGLLIVTLLVLATEGLFVFRPTARKIRQSIERMHKSAFALEQAREAAESANRAKTQFLNNISHELRTPMNAVLGLTELVLATEMAPEQRTHLSTAHSSAESLLHVLNETLDLSKIEAGRMELSCRPFELRSWLSAALEPLTFVARQKGLRLERQIAAEVPSHIIGDPERLRQILVNLVSNAIKFTAHGRISVSLDVVNRCEQTVTLALSVEDTGIGIAAENLDLIFTAFAQADPGITRRFGGTGLGLAIASQLAALMDGTIKVNSEPGQGSVFRFQATFQIPCDDNSTAAPVDDLCNSPGEVPFHLSAKNHQTHPLRILLAEDTEASQILVTSILEQAGHSVTVAGCGREAIELFAEHSFDLVLMDLQMPGVDGLAATAVIRQQLEATESTQRVPIVALTAHASESDQRQCLAAGMDDYLSKPMRAQQLLEVVDRWSQDSELASNSHDKQIALGRLSGNTALWAQLRELFLEASPDLMAQIDSAVSSSDCRSVEVLAHRLAGMAGTLAADELVSMALRLEAAGKRQNLPEVLNCNAKLRLSVARLRQRLLSG